MKLAHCGVVATQVYAAVIHCTSSYAEVQPSLTGRLFILIPT